jgi:hypothetical protein
MEHIPSKRELPPPTPEYMAQLLGVISPLQEAVESYIQGIPDGSRSQEFVLTHINNDQQSASSIFTIAGEYLSNPASGASHLALQVSVEDGRHPQTSQGDWIGSFSLRLDSVHEPTADSTHHTIAYEVVGVEREDSGHDHLEIKLEADVHVRTIDGREVVTVESGRMANTQSRDTQEAYGWEATEAMFATVATLVQLAA